MPKLVIDSSNLTKIELITLPPLFSLKISRKSPLHELQFAKNGKWVPFSELESVQKMSWAWFTRTVLYTTVHGVLYMVLFMGYYTWYCSWGTIHGTVYAIFCNFS